MRLPTIERSALTGQLRARPGWFGKQVVQVQLRIQAYSLIPPPPNFQGDPEDWRRQHAVGQPRFVWRDATWEDLQEMDRFRFSSSARIDALVQA